MTAEPVLIDSGLVGRKVFFMVRSQEERRFSILGPTQSRISPIISWYTKITHLRSSFWTGPHIDHNCAKTILLHNVQSGFEVTAGVVWRIICPFESIHVARLVLACFFFFITLKPRVEGYTSL